MSQQSTRPRQLDPGLPCLPAFGGSEAKGDFPSWDAYQACPERSRRAARAQALTRARIINMRATNRHLSVAQIAGHTGVSIQRACPRAQRRVKAALGLPNTFPSH